MDSKDLRIGNYVADENNVVKIIGYLDLMGRIKHYIPHTHNGLSEDEIFPIPITEGWLINFGFEKDVTHDCIVIYQDDVIALDLEFSCSDETISMGGQNCANEMENCKYIHQLQNLYYVLTGKELNLKY